MRGVFFVARRATRQRHVTPDVIAGIAIMVIATTFALLILASVIVSLVR